MEKILRVLLSAIAVSPMVGCTLVNLESATACTTAPTFYSSRTGTRVRSDGTTLWKGNPFFPFGFYHVSWYSTTPQLLNDIQAIAAGGFNTVHASAAYPENYQAVLDRAQQLGISLITEDGSPEMAARYGTHSAVMGWNIADDVDNGKHPVSTVTAKHHAVVANDQRHATYISGFSQNIPSYVNSANIIGMQSYPITVGKEEEISATYPQISILTNAVRTCNRSAYANLQTFNWGVAYPQPPGLRAPTAAEARNMTYQAIVAGAKGIIYYTYADRKWNLPVHAPQLWAGLKTLVPEMKTLTPYLLNGRVTRINSGQPKVFAGWWRLNQQAVLIVVNASYQNSPITALTLPTNTLSQQSLFSDRPLSEVKPAANRLQVRLSPLSVLVYQLQL